MGRVQETEVIDFTAVGGPRVTRGILRDGSWEAIGFRLPILIIVRIAEVGGLRLGGIP